jgi:sortase (surface protein transpeptidase)
MIKLIFYGILIYILYKLVFEFIIPVSKATGQIKSKIKEAQEQQRRFHEQQQQAEAQQQFQQKTPPTDTEYIDFEEIRDKKE